MTEAEWCDREGAIRRRGAVRAEEAVRDALGLSPAELATLDARRLPGESRTDAIRRLVSGR